MDYDDFLARLDRVQRRNANQAFASCPTSAHTHGDRSRGLSVKRTDDNRILVHCFASCSPEEILGALGLNLSDLFPDQPVHARGARPRWPLRELLEVIAHEALVAHVAAEQLGAGEMLSDGERKRVALAADRILTALELGGVSVRHNQTTR